MTFDSEYHISVGRSVPASVAVFALLALPLILLFVSSSAAQINGAPASVTSPGFGGRAINGTPASVTSLGRGGFARNVRGRARRGDEDHRHHHYSEYAPPAIYAIPYAADVGDAGDAADDNDADYQGGPTIFDRRGSGAGSYIPPVQDVPAPHAAQAADPPPDDPPEEPTVLVFKNGGTVEVENYAIVGATLFDLTPGHRRKVALADLDLDATRQQNDARGATFQLPPSQQAN